MVIKIILMSLAVVGCLVLGALGLGLVVLVLDSHEYQKMTEEDRKRRDAANAKAEKGYL